MVLKNMKNSFIRTTNYRLIMIALVTMFIIYNVVVYTQGTSNTTPKMSGLAIKGEVLYQENNCTACHQFYGLGGYLGPDLTNIISNKKKGPAYAKAFLNSGVKAMPKFDFTDDEQDALIQFLTEIDKTGYFPIVNAEANVDGWVDMKYKNQ